ncbi:15224_t:CDS:2, partial [Acaulospora colombiana]
GPGPQTGIKTLMSVDLSDPKIQSAYTSIVRSYFPMRSGTGGIEELQRNLSEDDAYFAFVREDKGFCLINFFPAGIPGVRRAVTSLFKAANVTITVSSAQQVEISAIRAKLGLERLPLWEKAPRAANGLQPVRNNPETVSEAPTASSQYSAPATNSRIPRPGGSVLSRATEDTPPSTPAKSSPLLLKRVSGQERRDAPLPPPPSTGEDAEDYEIVNVPTPVHENPRSRARGVSVATSFSDNQSTYSDETQHNTRSRVFSEKSWARQQSQISELDYETYDTASPVPLFRTEAQEEAARSRAKWAEEEGIEYSEYPRKARRGRTKSDIQRE